MPVQLLPVGNIFYVPKDRIEPNPFQPRELFADEYQLELTADILKRGQLQPCIVRNHPKRQGWYQLASGERRWRAILPTIIPTVEAKLQQLDDVAMAEVALAENLQRSTLTAWEEARGLQMLTEELEAAGITATNAELARRVNKSQAFVSKTLLLLQMPEEFRAVARRHALVKTSLLLIHQKAPADAQPALLEAVNNGASFQETQSAVNLAIAEAHIQQQSTRPPEAETAARVAAVAQGGIGTMSRGRQVTAGNGPREALQEFNRHRLGMEAWFEHISDADWKKYVEPWAREVLRGKLSRP